MGIFSPFSSFALLFLVPVSVSRSRSLILVLVRVLVLVLVPVASFPFSFRDTGFLLGKGVSLRNLLHSALIPRRDTCYFVQNGVSLH